MSGTQKKLGMLLAFPTEFIIIFLLMFYGGEYLNSKYPIAFNWSIVTSILGIICIINLLYRSYKMLIQDDKNEWAAYKLPKHVYLPAIMQVCLYKGCD